MLLKSQDELMRPLYIDGLPGCRVVVVSDMADKLFQLSRISRVVFKGAVEWSMSALLGFGNARKSLTQCLLDFLARGDGMQHYENWYLSMQKQALRSFAQRMRIRD